MTLRVNLICNATAVLALVMADAAAAHAAMRLCNAEPQRCRYSSDGRQYFHAAGSPISTGGGAAASDHGWGCGATNGTAKGRSWGFSNKAAASYRALSECSKRAPQGGCHVVSCSASVHSYDEAHVAWFANQ
jgi:hypothetical protein